ncbi:protein JASON isoform X2 [Euphorbia lathyris]|uniref:protein JASON isoform X2 n=1 Tax=Euphorbia lathyris TaxID=212925 RepID=UPI003313D32A
MICAFLNRLIRLLCRSVLRYIDRSLSRVMGCLLGCFRTKDDRRRPHIVSDSVRTKQPEVVVSANRLSSLFLSEEGEDFVHRKNHCLGSGEINKELVDEAKFLKACGTLPETPAEIRKASKGLKSSPPLNKGSESPDFRSWLPNTSIKKFQLDNQIDESSFPIKLCDELGHGSPSSELTPTSCISIEQNTGSKSFSVDDATSKLPVKNKSVRFDCNFDTSSCKRSSEDMLNVSRRSDSPGDSTASKPSPRPTPLKLSEEMQTPGTVFPASLEVLGNGKTRMRSQYVHPLLNPIENVGQWKELQQDNFTSHELSSQLKESIEQLENSSPEAGVGLKEASLQELKVETSLSAWFKPKQAAQAGDPIDRTAANTNFHFGRTPMDRPIIGMVAAHWNENEPTNISPKWWDGNGIPNSTNKYKEDQKVSWHATPFEERLEKALSEESFISQKVPMSGTPIVFDEQDEIENDTALSKLQPATHSKSVMSIGV